MALCVRICSWRWYFLPCLGRVYQHALASCCSVLSIHNSYSLPACPLLLHTLPTFILQKQHPVYSKIPMLAVFLIVFLCRHYGTSAAPIADSGPPIYDIPTFARDGTSGANDGRTAWDILRSCAATTVALTWVSVHPNVFLEETSLMILKRRIFLMVLTLLAPEMMIMWAFKQWRGAVMIKEIVNKAKPESCMSCTCGIDNMFDG